MYVVDRKIQFDNIIIYVGMSIIKKKKFINYYAEIISKVFSRLKKTIFKSYVIIIIITIFFIIVLERGILLHVTRNNNLCIRISVNGYI